MLPDADEFLRMMRAYFRRTATCMLITLIGVATPAYAQDKSTDAAINATLGDHTKYKQVILAFQKAINNHDAAGVAALVGYPIKVKIDGKDTIVKTKKSFVANYDKIITPAIAKVIKNQKYEDLMVSYQGVMLGQGEAWINGICLDNSCNKVDVKVVTIQGKSSAK